MHKSACSAGEAYPGQMHCTHGHCSRVYFVGINVGIELVVTIIQIYLKMLEMLHRQYCLQKQIFLFLFFYIKGLGNTLKYVENIQVVL